MSEERDEYAEWRTVLTELVRVQMRLWGVSNTERDPIRRLQVIDHVNVAIRLVTGLMSKLAPERWEREDILPDLSKREE